MIVVIMLIAIFDVPFLTSYLFTILFGGNICSSFKAVRGYKVMRFCVVPSVFGALIGELIISIGIYPRTGIFQHN